jgi:hypothetical protein
MILIKEFMIESLFIKINHKILRLLKKIYFILQNTQQGLFFKTKILL